MTNIKFTIDCENLNYSKTLSTVTDLRNEMKRFVKENDLGMTEHDQEHLINLALVYRESDTDTQKGTVKVTKTFEFVNVLPEQAHL